MNKIWLITQREYLTRVKSKTFLLTTILAPLGILVFVVIVGFIFSQGSDEQKIFAVSDEYNVLESDLENTGNMTFERSNESLSELKQRYLDGEIDGIIEIPQIQDPTLKKIPVLFHSDDQLAIDESSRIADKIEDQLREYKIKALELDKTKIESLDTDVTLEPRTIEDTGKQISSITGIVGSVLGGAISYIMFIIIIIYGAQVMRSVMEEKISRVVEVMISSVRPFELMMGKIIGVGSVGLTQVAIWMLLFPIIFLVSSLFFDINPNQVAEIANTPGADVNAAMTENQDKIALVYKELASMNWLLMVPLIIIYFFGGYFAYAALFAAVGSAVGEDVNEAQGLTIPVMIPLILAIYISMSAVTAPNNSLSVWASIIPLLSSVVMPVRLPSGPPLWQIFLSVILLIAFVILLTWIAARIYRVGILMYGKKATFKELGKWLFYKS